MVKTLIKTEYLVLIKAVLKEGKNDFRQALEGINITNTHVEATNGRSALRIPITELSETIPKTGNYGIISAKKVNKILSELILELKDQEYPDLGRVWPEKNTLLATLNIPTEKEKYGSVSAAIIKLYKHTESAFNYYYIKPLSLFGSEWDIYSPGKDKAILMVSREYNIEYVILPMSL